MSYDNAPAATHFNYVVFFPQTNRVKVGVTGNPRKRVGYYKQEATRHALGYVTMSVGRAQPKHFARIVETEICRYLKPYAIPKHREWFEMDAEGFEDMKAMTKRFQDGVRAAFATRAAHA
ncbi:GIY-YIG nuclease family protein [Variovorax sp. RT4R15]|uniref:GIY-YIG nuclease family protein n=1 Tax=Variovorax sp. RT4R15 TaxID=3443737 RepID=UPI003F46D9F8